MDFIVTAAVFTDRNGQTSTDFDLDGHRFNEVRTNLDGFRLAGAGPLARRGLHYRRLSHPDGRSYFLTVSDPALSSLEVAAM